jgi:hypothetical protein
VKDVGMRAGSFTIILAVVLGFSLVAFVRQASQDCYLVGEMCLTRPGYFGAWLAVLLLFASGVIAYAKSTMNTLGMSIPDSALRDPLARFFSGSRWVWLTILAIGVIAIAVRLLGW